MNGHYFDHAATTPVRHEVLEAMLPYFSEIAGNPSSIHMFGQNTKRALENSRQTVAELLGVAPKELNFTSGGTESNNLAIKGVAYANADRGRHLITTQIEHHAVLTTMQSLEAQGFEVTYLPVDQHGMVDLQTLERSIRDDTILISVMLANNEVGTIEPLAEVAAIAKSKGALLHTDAVQAMGKMAVNANSLGVDLLTLTAHKFYGPRGAGGLYVRKGVRISPLLHGGHQEHTLRPGTENLPAIVGLATALRLACEDLDAESSRLRRLRDRLEATVWERIPDVSANGHPELRLPHISNLNFASVEGESLLMALDLQGVAVSTGSACTSGSTEVSHVLQAMGVEPALAQGSLRLSLGRETSEEDVEYVVEALVDIVDRLRQISPT